MNRAADPVPPGTFPETSLGGYLPSGRRPSPDAGGPTGHAAVAAFEQRDDQRHGIEAACRGDLGKRPAL